MRDIMDEVMKRAPNYLEVDGERMAMTAIIADENLRGKAIQALNSKMKPYRNKDLPPEITTDWITRLYLQAKDHSDEHQTVIEEIRRDFILGSLRNIDFCR